MGHRLVQQAEPIPDTAISGTCNQMQGGLGNLGAFFFSNGGEVGGQGLHIDATQVKALAAAEHCHRHLTDFGGGEDEFHVFRRLFQCLQQGIKGVP